MKRTTILMAAAIIGLLASFEAYANDDVELDKFKCSDAGAWSCAKSIAIASLRVPADFKGKMSKEEYANAFVNQLAQGFRSMPGVTEVLLVKPGETPGADILIEGEFTKLTTGSRAARFWVGLGAGRSKCGVRLHATTVQAKRVVFELEHARVSTEGLKSDELLENIEETSDDVVRALSQLRGACPDAKMFPTRSPPKDVVLESTRTVLDSQPQGAEAFIDGKFVGNTPIASYPISAGGHMIQFRKTGYAIWSRDVEVTEGANTRFFGELTLEQPAQAAPLTSELPAASTSSPSAIPAQVGK